VMVVVVVAAGDVVVVDVVVVIGVKVVVVEVELIDDHICFGAYHRLNFSHQSSETTSRSIGHTI